MTRAKHPGVGKGVGGGRPRRSDAERLGSVRLPAEAARRLREHCEAVGQSLGDALGELIMQGLPIAPATGTAKGLTLVVTPPSQPRPSWLLKSSRWGA
jgi:hypothetical protein